MTLNRRNLITKGAALTFVASSASLIGVMPALAEHTPATRGGAPAPSSDGKIYDVKKLMVPDGPADHFLGNKDAKVTIIEYASSTCSFCASFHVNTYPQLKETYIDSGEISFVLRPFVLNVLDAAVFLLAYKAGESGSEHYYNVLDAYLKTQSNWAQAENPRQALLDIAKQLGFNEESFDAALTNQELFEGIEKLREQASRKFGMRGTPSFYINGKFLSGNRSFEDMANEIDPLLG